MEVLFSRCCGLDVHERFVVACLSIVENGCRTKEVRRFSTFPSDVVALRQWLLENYCTHIAMESTGIYWKPLYWQLYGYVELIVVNAHQIKALPGRKTDTQDAEWIVDLLQHGLLKPSFIPSVQQQELRDLTRLRITFVQDRSRFVNRLHKALEEVGIKLSAVLTDLMGVSGRAMVEALVAGETNPEVVVNKAHSHMLGKHDQLLQAVTCELREHHRFLLRELLCLIDTLDRSIRHVEVQIAERLRPFEDMLVRLEKITGVSRRVLSVLFAEVGWDMSPFPDAAHLASWAGMCPGQNESGGKRRSGRIRKGNRWVKSALVQAAHAAGRTQSYLGEQYRRLKKRKGSKRAAVAVGHSILVIFYHMMVSGEAYKEKGVDYFRARDAQRLQYQLTHRLEQLGYQVQLQALPGV